MAPYSVMAGGETSISPQYNSIFLDYSRDKLLTEFGRTTTRDRYHSNGEDDQQMFARVALAGSDNLEHAQRLYDYFSKHWAMPATPVLSNLGTKRGFPISCFLGEVGDSLDSIFDTYVENAALASYGGGIGTYWGNLRSLGTKIRDGAGETSGIIPFLKIMDSATLAVSQGNLRRGSAAVYLDIHHPEIEEFLEIRKPTGGDVNRKTLNLHHGVIMTDAFMEAVEKGEDYNLVCPRTKEILRRVNAREIWQKILTTRVEQGEPYVIFIDTINKNIPDFHKKEGLTVKTSNLCSEICLPTNHERTAICCLAQLNQYYYDEWKKDPLFIEDIVRFADNVLTAFVHTAPEKMRKAKFSASQERSLGIGVMGFHSYLQKNSIPFECAIAKSININMGKHIASKCREATIQLAQEKGPCPDAARHNVMVRNANVTAIAPTASVSIIAGTVSPAMEPYVANAFTHKTLSGSFLVKNRDLENLLESIGHNTNETWSSIVTHEGSVQHLDFLTDDDKDVYKTAFEIDQRWIIEHAAVRQQYVDQAISTNIFLPADIDKAELNFLHYIAWKKGLKSLYYCRSKSLKPADAVSHKIERIRLDELPIEQETFVGETPDFIQSPIQLNPGQFEVTCMGCQ